LFSAYIEIWLEGLLKIKVPLKEERISYETNSSYFVLSIDQRFQLFRLAIFFRHSLLMFRLKTMMTKHIFAVCQWKTKWKDQCFWVGGQSCCCQFLNDLKNIKMKWMAASVISIQLWILGCNSNKCQRDLNYTIKMKQ